MARTSGGASPCISSATPTRSRWPTKGPAGRHSAPARPQQSRHHVGLPASHRQRRDHRHRPRPPRAHDVCQRVAAALTAPARAHRAKEHSSRHLWLGIGVASTRHGARGACAGIWFGPRRGSLATVRSPARWCAPVRSPTKTRFGGKCVRFGIPSSRDPRNPDVGKLLEQGARFRVQGSDVLLANLRAAVYLIDHEL
jgi:hypothetical protein